MNFKKTIQEQIEKAPYTIPQIAKHLGIGRSTLYRRLDNPSNFTAGELEKLGQLLETPGWELLRRAEQANNQ